MRSHSRKRVAICGVSVDIPHCARNRWGDSALMESLGQAHSRRTQGVRLGAGRASKARRAGGTPLPQYQSVTIRSVTCKVSLFGSVEEHELLWSSMSQVLCKFRKGQLFTRPRQDRQGTYRAHRRPRWSPTSARSRPPTAAEVQWIAVDIPVGVARHEFQFEYIVHWMLLALFLALSSRHL